MTRGYDAWLSAPYDDMPDDDLTEEEREEAEEREMAARDDAADRAYDEMKMRQLFGEDY